MQLLNLTWGAGASVAAGILLEKWKTESKPIQVWLTLQSGSLSGCLHTSPHQSSDFEPCPIQQCHSCNTCNIRTFTCMIMGNNILLFGFHRLN